MSDEDLDLPPASDEEALSRPEGYGVAAPAALRDPYGGLATEAVTQYQADILTAPFPPEMIDILPTGETYIGQVEYRRRLIAAFGPMGWGMRPLSPLVLRNSVMMRDWALIVHGRCVGSAVGEQEYFEESRRQSYATAAESVKSNALVRICKDLGIGSECWDRRFTRQFRDTYCVRVRVKSQGTYKGLWRRQDADPFPGEAGPWTDEYSGGGRERSRPPRDEVQDLAKVAFPSDVFGAGTEAGLTTAEVSTLIEGHFKKKVTELAKGDECRKAIEHIRSVRV